VDKSSCIPSRGDTTDRLALLAMLFNVFRTCTTPYNIGSLRGYVKKYKRLLTTLYACCLLTVFMIQSLNVVSCSLLAVPST
jgi:hypothetical protein